MKTLIVIPARLASTRLPRKLLQRETGKPLIQHTFESAQASQLADRIIIATDDLEIVTTAESFGAEAWLTDPQHSCGTDRLAEVAAKLPEYDLVVNLQGDEPELPASAIDLAVSVFTEQPSAVMASLATPIRDRAVLESPHCVKVVLDQQSRALYFSRAPIPFAREWLDTRLMLEPPSFWQHVGLYVYRREFLLTLSQLPPAAIESIESLEQLRVLAAGIPIHIRRIEHPVRGIDTLDDYQAFVRRSANR